MKDNNTKERLLLLAKEEFLNRGFNNVSMRDISKSTGMALGNIYYYFKTKDELFRAILFPVLDEFDEIVEAHHRVDSMSENLFDLSKINSHTWHFYDLIEKHRKELFLLFYMSQGSSLERFTDVLIDRFTQMGMGYVNNYKHYYQRDDVDIDSFFMRVYSSMTIAIIKEIVRHDKIPKASFERFSEKISLFTISGWQNMMRV